MPDSSPRALRLWTTTLGSPEAPLVLVLHGITASRRYWLPRILPLARHHWLLVPDLPGFGQSPKPFVDYTMEFFVEAVLGLLEQRRVSERRLSIIGHSLGALLALELAVRLPDQVERVALLSMPRFTSPEAAHRIMLAGSASYRRLLTVNSMAANWAQMKRTGWRLTARNLRRLPWSALSDARKFTFRSLSSTLEHCLMHYDVDPVLARFPSKTPALMIHGAQDSVAPVENVAELCERPPHPTLRIIPEAGHNPFHTHTGECLDLIQRLLENPQPKLARTCSRT